MLQWSVVYEANHAILTVEQHVPDQGSTFLLLTLGLLGLMTYRQSCGVASPERRARYCWEIIADNLSKAGWSWGCVATVDSNGRTIFIADAHRESVQLVRQILARECRAETEI